MWTILTAGLLLGAISSLHCVGMCGPLALALPVGQLSRNRQILAALMYHLGRILTYSFLGALFGWMGRRIWLAGWQQGFSIFLGVLTLLILAWIRLGRNVRQPILPGKWYNGLLRWMTRLWQSPSRLKFILLGMGNGLLPCGMVYLAVAAAISTSKMTYGIAFMAAFGAGTLPLMLLLHYSVHLIRPSLRLQFRKWSPFLLAFTALLLILRGLGLGIPFISPVLASASGTIISCH